MRALVDGVVIGVTTAIHDSPLLTVRLCDGPNPARVVIDPNGRLPDDSPVLRADGTRRVVIQSADTARPPGVEVVRLAARNGRFEPEEIVAALRRVELERLLIEGGSFTIARFVEAGVLDRMHVAVSPILIGNGPTGITLANKSKNMADVIRPDTRIFSLGPEVIFDCGLTAAAEVATKPLH
jgi:riboflavin biosynthesis pyrimidine reductase